MKYKNTCYYCDSKFYSPSKEITICPECCIGYAIAEMREKDKK